MNEISKNEQILQETEKSMDKLDLNNNTKQAIPSSNSFEAVYLNNLRISFDGKVPPSDSINSIFDYNLKITNQENSLDTIVQGEEDGLLDKNILKNNVSEKIQLIQVQECLLRKERNILKTTNHLQKSEDNEKSVANKIHSFQGHSLLKRAESLDEKRNPDSSFKTITNNLPQIENLKNESKVSFTGSCHSVKDLRGKFENFTSECLSFKKITKTKTPVTKKFFTEVSKPTNTSAVDLEKINVNVKDRVSDLNKVSELIQLNDKKSKSKLNQDLSFTIFQKPKIGEDRFRSSSAHADDQKNEFSRIKPKVLINESHQTQNCQMFDKTSGKTSSIEVNARESRRDFAKSKKNLTSYKIPLFDPFKKNPTISRQFQNCTKILNISKPMLNNLNNSKTSVNSQEKNTEKHLTTDQIIDVIRREIDFNLKENLGKMSEKNEDKSFMEDTINKLCESIKNALCEKFNKHKFIVKSVIGYSLFEMPVVSHICYWDENSDTCATYSFSKENYFIMVTAFALFSP